MDVLSEDLAQTFHRWTGQRASVRGRADSLVSRPGPCGLPGTAGTPPPAHRAEGLVSGGQVPGVPARARDVRYSSQVTFY